MDILDGGGHAHMHRALLRILVDADPETGMSVVEVGTKVRRAGPVASRIISTCLVTLLREGAIERTQPGAYRMTDLGRVILAAIEVPA